MNKWYEHSFGEDYLLVYQHRDRAGAQEEVHAMMNWLHLSPGAEVLDLCCGMGRHALAIHARGYRVTGVDLSATLLHEAKQLVDAEHVKFVLGDMRDVPLQQQFDAIVNLFTSFGYFEEDEENKRVCLEINRLLKPGGQFIIDYLNPTYLSAHLVPQSMRQIGELVIQEKREIKGLFVRKQITIEPVSREMYGEQEDHTGQAGHTDQQGQASRTEQEGHASHTEQEGQASHTDQSRHVGHATRVYHEQVKLYERPVFEQMLMEAGLCVDHVFGDYDGHAYDQLTSKRMIFVGHK